jgi:superfamily I DNA and/or RNA helicase
MAFRCTIARIDLDTITLALRAAQSDARVFLREKGKCWAIEHDFMEASYSSLYRGMHAFLSAPKERRDLLLLQRPPRVDRSLRLNGDYGPFNDLVLAGKQARDCFLIIGPPGTGKTSYGMLYALREELTEPGSTVLLLSYTNRAVDEICSKLEEDGIDYLRLGSPLSCSAESQGKLLGEVAAGSPNLASLKRRLGEVRVVAATTTAMSANVALFRLKTFSLAIIDEASQILEPHLMGILSACHGRGVSAVGRFLMIGDHKQLPAVVQQTPEVSEVTEPELRAVLLTDCRLSLFERLLKRYREDPQVVYMLTHQGRMHRDIAEFPNRAFYGGRLDVVPLDHQLQPLPAVGTSQNGIDNLLTTRRIAFLHVESPAETLSDKVNTAEAEVIAATVLRIHHLHRATFDPDKTVGVIVPYRNQIATVRNLLDRSGIPALHDITIDTVERYQGSQRAYIIYGFTIQKYYQLNFLTNNVFEDWDGSIIDRKLNVAMTRAREHLIMVGNAALLQHNVTFDRLLDFVRERKGWLSVPVAQYVAGDFRLEE